MGIATDKKLILAPVSSSDFTAAAVGGVFGGLASFLVTHLLLELTFSPVFSTFFAILLSVIGIVVIQRALSIQPVPPPALDCGDNDDVDSGGDRSGAKLYTTQIQTRRLLFAFAFMIVLSAVFALFVDRAWFTNINWIVKIPMYCLLGNTLCFLLVFAGVDIVNFYYDIAWWEGWGGTSNGGLCFVSSPSATLPVHNSSQVCVLVVGSLLLGSVFGFFYGLFDLEDLHSSVRMIQSRYVCVPIAVIIGTFTAVLTGRLGRVPGNSSSNSRGLAATGFSGTSDCSRVASFRQGSAQQAVSADNFLDDEEDEEDAMFFGRPSV